MLEASNVEEGDRFGERLALSVDGATLAVSALLEDSAASGIDGDLTNDDTLRLCREAVKKPTWRGL
jgi:hypothetical protein